MPGNASDRATLAEMTTDVVAAFLAGNRVQPGDVSALIGSVHAALGGLGRAPERAAAVAAPTPPVPIRKTVSDGHIISLEDGKPYRALKRHLTKRGLTPAAYRAKWGLPADYPMVAPAYARQRSELARQIGLGHSRWKS